MATRGFATKRATRALTSSSSASGGATWLIKPFAQASSAEMKSPVTSISKAALRGRFRDNATPGVEQNSPTLTPLTAKRASWLAIARSHIATSWQPAAVARPCTRAITGTGRRWIASITAEHCVNSCW
jgi:hypothetical protein